MRQTEKVSQVGSGKRSINFFLFIILLRKKTTFVTKVITM